MALINLTLQGKGGVGKSLVSALLAQHYAARGTNPLCFDTDPVNQTLGGFRALSVERVSLGPSGGDIDPRAFDGLMESLLAAPDDAVVVIDNGAATFLPLGSYLAENNAVAMLMSEGHEVRIHTVLTGGQGMDDTVRGLYGLLSLSDVPIVVWLNAFFGPVERDGKGFEDTKLYKENKARFYALVTMPSVRKETFGVDVAAMLQARLTFDEAVQSETFNVMSRQRLKTLWRMYSAEMDKAQL